MVVVGWLQLGAAFGGAAALAPQIWLNQRRGGAGEFSPITAALLTVRTSAGVKSCCVGLGPSI
jgi:hypothetical protein